jgi:hypothetical protein
MTTESKATAVDDMVVGGPFRAHIELQRLYWYANNYESDRTLVLHFDVNGTTFRKDATDGHDADAAADNEIMAKLTYGTVVDGDWVINTDPMRRRDSGVSYYEWARAKCGPKELKAVVAAFIDGPGAPMRALYEHMRKHPAGAIFMSVLLVVLQFPEAVVVFRTFGSDGAYLISQLVAECMIPSAHSCLQFTVVSTVSKAPAASKRHYRCESTGRTYTQPQFNKLLETLGGRFVVVQEDYKHWADNGKDPKCGKAMLGTPRLDQIGFDDLGTKCWHVTGQFASLKHINTYRACTDPAYYLRLIVDELRTRPPTPAN